MCGTQGIWSAEQRRFVREFLRGYREGLQGAEPALVVYASDQAHSSIEKDALLAGFGIAAPVVCGDVELF